MITSREALILYLEMMMLVNATFRKISPILENLHVFWPLPERCWGLSKKSIPTDLSYSQSAIRWQYWFLIRPCKCFSLPKLFRFWLAWWLNEYVISCDDRLLSYQSNRPDLKTIDFVELTSLLVVYTTQFRIVWLLFNLQRCVLCGRVVSLFLLWISGL